MNFSTTLNLSVLKQMAINSSVLKQMTISVNEILREKKKKYYFFYSVLSYQRDGTVWETILFIFFLDI